MRDKTTSTLFWKCVTKVQNIKWDLFIHAFSKLYFANLQKGPISAGIELLKFRGCVHRTTEVLLLLG